MELTVRIHLPVTPMAGDPIEFEGRNVAVTGEFARLLVGENRFIVDATDGACYEVDVVDAGSGRGESQRWNATRAVSRSDFEQLGRTQVPETVQMRLARIRSITESHGEQ
jgi:hypothetical protein